MTELIMAIQLVLLGIYVLPFVAYGGAGRFLLGVMVTKLGTAVAFAPLSAFITQWFVGRGAA